MRFALVTLCLVGMAHGASKYIQAPGTSVDYDIRGFGQVGDRVECLSSRCELAEATPTAEMVDLCLDSVGEDCVYTSEQVVKLVQTNVSMCREDVPLLNYVGFLTVDIRDFKVAAEAEIVGVVLGTWFLAQKSGATVAPHKFCHFSYLPFEDVKSSRCAPPDVFSQYEDPIHLGYCGSFSTNITASGPQMKSWLTADYPTIVIVSEYGMLSCVPEALEVLHANARFSAQYRGRLAAGSDPDALDKGVPDALIDLSGSDDVEAQFASIPLVMALLALLTFIFQAPLGT